MAVVDPDERSAATGVTGAAISPSITRVLMSYPLLLKPPEEKQIFVRLTPVFQSKAASDLRRAGLKRPVVSWAFLRLLVTRTGRFAGTMTGF